MNELFMIIMQSLPGDLSILLDSMYKSNMRYVIRVNKSLPPGNIELHALSNNMPMFQLIQLIKDYCIIGYQKIFDNIFLIGENDIIHD